MSKILKYFELPVLEASKWDLKDYLLFAVDSLYSTCLPFFGGMLLVSRHEWYWIFMLILPIYFKLDFQKIFEGKKKRRVYI
jgi:hypothetical protein